MGKIIELLNDFIPEGWSIEHGGKSIFYEGVCYNDRIIGKDFGFIKRLYDNDKIDQNTKFLISVNVENQKNGMEYTKAFEGYESLLMLLAIQDEPIEFLISILK